MLSSLALTAVCGGSSPTTIVTPPPSSGLTSCAAAQAATFGWWAGTWAYSVPGFDPGTTTVTASNGGCTIQEAFVDIHNMQAHTTIQFDSAGKQWKRTVTDPFRTYQSAGTFASDGSIAFYETTTERESYRPTDPTHVHFIGESSTDGGKTWKVQFDATYTKK